MVSRDRQIWHCFGCSLGGDIFGFVMQYENVEFIEALKVLAEKAGISISEFGSSDQKKYEELYEINRIAADFYFAHLSSKDCDKARKYLKDRGVSEKSIEEFQIGFAGPEFDALTTHLSKMGYAPPQIEKAGLSFKTKSGTYHDRFQNRIMFPLFNQFGKVVGFTGRILPGHELENTGKYVNSPETPIFNKSKVLYGFDKTKKYIRDVGTAVVVEGQMDVILSYQDEVKNVVASSGTAMTTHHISALQKVAERLVLIFDNDQAGQLAAQRTIDLANAADMSAFIVIFQEGTKDPADLVKESPGKLKEAIRSAVPAMEYYFHFYKIDPDMPITEKKKALRGILEKIIVLASPVERMHWTKELALKSGTSEETLIQEMELVRKKGNAIFNPADKRQEKNQESEKSKTDSIVQEIFCLLVETPKFKDEVKKHQVLFPKRYQPVLDYLLGDTKKDPDESFAGIINAIDLRVGLRPTEKPEEELQSLLKALTKERKKFEIQVLNQKIKKAEQSGDKKLHQELLKEHTKIYSKD